MWVLMIIIGVIVGYVLNIPINSYSNKLARDNKSYRQWIRQSELGIITAIFFLISFLNFDITISLLQALLLNCTLIAVTVIDIRHRIIPNKLVLIIFILGVVFLVFGSISVLDALLGIIAGGGLLYLLSLIPRAMGGGDVKFMFAMGVILGLKGVIWALMLGFLLASIVSIFLLAFRIIGRKDHIPFGPFLALGSFIAFHFII